MSPQAALDYQIKKYRELSGKERLGIALDLHELSCDITREGVRVQYPRANAAEVEKRLRRRLELARTL